jgi:hypothetical protein
MAESRWQVVVTVLNFYLQQKEELAKKSVLMPNTPGYFLTDVKGRL